MNSDHGNFDNYHNNLNSGDTDYFKKYVTDILGQCLNAALSPAQPVKSSSQLNDIIQDITNKSFNQSVNFFINEFYGPSVVQPLIIPPASHPPLAAGTTDNPCLNQTGSVEESQADIQLHRLATVDSHGNESDSDQESAPESLNLQSSIAGSSDETAQGTEESSNQSFNSQYIPPVIKKVAIQPEILVTHDFVIIKVKIPQSFSEKDFKISVNSNHAVIKWNLGYFEQVVKLPPDIIRDNATAAVLDGILEVKIPRMQHGTSREISIDHL